MKDYFLNYRETTSNDFVLTKGGDHIEMLGTDISDWTITFIDTGMDTAIGERLRRVRPYLDDDEMFLANYGDVLTDAPMDELIVAVHGRRRRRPAAGGEAAGLLPRGRHRRRRSGHGSDPGRRLVDADQRWLLRAAPGIFDYLDEGDDLVMDGCVRAAADGRMSAVPYDGFWAPMDTLKERSALETMYKSGISPWALWRPQPVARGRIILPVDEATPDAG